MDKVTCVSVGDKVMECFRKALGMRDFTEIKYIIRSSSFYFMHLYILILF